jgi:hypothetical protein
MGIRDLVMVTLLPEGAGKFFGTWLLEFNLRRKDNGTVNSFTDSCCVNEYSLYLRCFCTGVR